ncbi:oxidoreductase [Hymenobacter gummosus]|uniref:Oxidoreductase n=1 Tax=Hymenobacter gummosus TaxID=1776032 RepID=A0A431U4Z7_9BACT|nr:oxidoreductase [Hymenobacter gummosus]RTQ50762.1 oxidoreductase [Hymenobacter gummosus]
MEPTSSGPQKVALIAGASGLVGSQLLPLLLNSGRYAKVISVGRRPLPLLHPLLVQRTVSFDDLEAHRLSLIADDVYCCLGTTMRQAGSKEAFYKVDFLYVVKLAALTAANFAAQLMVVSAMGADEGSTFYYNRVKGEMEAAVRQAPFRAIHIFRPSLLLGQRPEKRLGEQIGTVLLRVLGPLLVGPLRRYRGISAQAVAQAMLNAAYQDGGGVRVYQSDEIAAGISPQA